MTCTKGSNKLIVYILWIGCVIIPTVFMPYYKSISIIPIFLFTFMYDGGLDYLHYQSQINALNYESINYERILLYLISSLFGSEGIVIIKVMALPLYILSVDQFLVKVIHLKAQERVIVHLTMLMIPHGYIAALTIFRQVFAISFMLLALSYRNKITSAFLLGFSAISHLTSPLQLILYKFMRLHAVVILVVISAFFVMIDRFDIYPAFLKLNHSTSYSIFLLLISVYFMFLSIILSELRTLLNFSILSVLSALVIFGFLPADILTRLINYSAIFIALDILILIKKSGRNLIGKFTILFISALNIVTLVGVLDRPEYTIQL